MHGFNIFKHSVAMVFRNFPHALKIILPLGGIAALWFIIISMWLERSSIGTLSPGQIALLAVPSVLMVFFLLVWATTAWHRYVLLEERGSILLPAIKIDRILAYFGRAFLLGLLLAVVAFPLLFLVLPFVTSGGLGLVIVPVVVGVIMTCIFYRVALVLPAAAIGKPLRFAEAWDATRGSTGAILVLALISSIATHLVEQRLAPVLGSSLTGEVLVILVHATWGLVNVSIITTLYGHYVEGRPLS